MNFLHFFLILNSALKLNCERKLHKIENCTSTEELSHIVRCDLVNGMMSVVYDIKAPISKAMIEYCFFKFESSKFRPLGKCQHFDRCNLFNHGPTSNPILSGLFKILKHMGASIAQVTAPCPLYGRQEFLNISLYSNFLTILPRGMLLIRYKMYNNDGIIIGMSIVIANR
ncbi:unnamed protein product [Chironomus riparius]|uniref:Uncharacterized protein n=1 Tax=Chironomus riparius TaxID=315576 RepID=A0A9N9WZT5_9DIPT|nr:unnamed protein product [Chironomus riparius]